MIWVIHAVERGRVTETTAYRSREAARAALVDEAENSRDDGFQVEEDVQGDTLTVWEDGDRAHAITYDVAAMSAAAVRGSKRPRIRIAHRRIDASRWSRDGQTRIAIRWLRTR